MGLPVDIVKIHHQGGGSPNNNALDPYSMWIGPSGYQMIHSPLEDYSTLNMNGIVLGICFSGQRQDGIAGDPSWPVTDAELSAVRDGCMDARRRGWITDLPVVSPHDNLNGSATACPGTQVYNRWDDVVAAVEGNVAPVPVPNPNQEDRPLFVFRRPKTANNTYLGNGFEYRWLRSQAELDTYVVLYGLPSADPNKIAVFNDQQVAGMTYVGPQPS